MPQSEEVKSCLKSIRTYNNDKLRGVDTLHLLTVIQKKKAKLQEAERQYVESKIVELQGDYTIRDWNSE